MRKRIKIHTFDPDKSHLSSELKASFLLNCTLQSSVSRVPGVGSVTTSLLSEQNIFTVGDLLQAAPTFQALKNVVGVVNHHRIYDALLAFREKHGTGMPSTPVMRGESEKRSFHETQDTDKLVKELEVLGLVDNKEDEALEKQITACVTV